MLWNNFVIPDNAYYIDDDVVIYNGDCRVLLPGLPPADMIFADPPFNVNKEYETFNPEYYQWCQEWIESCYAILKDTGSFYHMTIPRHLESIYPLMKAGGVFINEIHWSNNAANHNRRSYWNSYQPILFYGKTENYKFNTYAQTRENFKRWKSWESGGKGQMLDTWDDISYVFAGSVVHPEAILRPGTCKKEHPCQMPQGLVARAMLFSTDPEDLVVDPFSGIGTTIRTAKNLNRKAIVIEIKERYCELAVKRMSQTVMTL